MAVVPTYNGKGVCMLDVGANTEIRPEHMLQHAHFATVFYRETRKVEKPLVGLINIGTEPGKGRDQEKEVFKLLNLSGVCRIDYLIDKKTNKFYINEPNTIPGSLSFYLWEPTGKKYMDLLDEMITLAIKDYKNRARRIYSFESNILSNYGIKGAKGIKK